MHFIEREQGGGTFISVLAMEDVLRSQRSGALAVGDICDSAHLFQNANSTEIVSPCHLRPLAYSDKSRIIPSVDSLVLHLP